MSDKVLDNTISNSMQLFQNAGFKVRVVMRDGEPWFVAKDVAACIEHSNPSTMCKMCKERDVVVESSVIFDSKLSLESEQNSVVSTNGNTTLISENGLYRILCKSNLPKSEPFESWVFDEVLPSIRKTGRYGELSDAEIMSRALEIAHRTLALREERIKSLEAQRDEAIRTKAMIGSKREATAMATASVKSKECKKLTAENEDLKDAVGRGSNWRTIAMMKAEWIREFGHAPVWQKLKQFSQDVKIDPVKDVEEKVILPNGREKINLSFRYHREAWARYRKYEENLRVTDIEIANV